MSFSNNSTPYISLNFCVLWMAKNPRKPWIFYSTQIPTHGFHIPLHSLPSPTLVHIYCLSCSNTPPLQEAAPDLHTSCRSLFFSRHTRGRQCFFFCAQTRTSCCTRKVNIVKNTKHFTFLLIGTARIQGRSKWVGIIPHMAAGTHFNHAQNYNFMR